MTPEALATSLAQLTAQTGLDGCALVDASTGLIWQAAGDTRAGEGAWEAAIDYWRLYQRQQQHFQAFGALGAAVMHHQRGVLAVLPCSDEPPVVVVAFGPHRKVDWLACQRAVRTIGALLSVRHGTPTPTPVLSSPAA